MLDELGRLADVSSKTAGLPALRAQLQSVGDQLYSAKVRAAELQTEFAATLEPTAALTRNYQKAQQAVAALELQQTQLGVAIKTHENALAAAGISTENLDAADRQLQGQMAATRAEALSLAAAHREAAAAGEAEALTMTEVAERSVVLRSAFEQLKVVLGTIGGFLALEEAKKQIEDILATGDKFKNFQIEFANAFGGAKTRRGGADQGQGTCRADPLVGRSRESCIAGAQGRLGSVQRQLACADQFQRTIRRHRPKSSAG